MFAYNSLGLCCFLVFSLFIIQSQINTVILCLFVEILNIVTQFCDFSVRVFNLFFFSDFCLFLSWARSFFIIFHCLCFYFIFKQFLSFSPSFIYLFICLFRMFIGIYFASYCYQLISYWPYVSVFSFFLCFCFSFFSSG